MPEARGLVRAANEIDGSVRGVLPGHDLAGGEPVTGDAQGVLGAEELVAAEVAAATNPGH